MKKILSSLLVAVILIGMLSCGITVSAQTSSVNLIGTSLKGFDTANWTATAANSIIDGKIICAPNAGTNTAETVSTYTLGKYFKLEFYASVITYTNYYGEHMSVSVGDVELRITNVKGVKEYYLSLFINGNEVATHALDSANVGGNFSMKLENGKISATHKDVPVVWTVGEATDVTEIDASDINITNAKIKAKLMNNYSPAANRHFKDFALYGGPNGDYDFDGAVTSADALVAKQALLGLGGTGTMTDVNHDGKVTATDFLKLRGHALGTALVDGYEYKPVNIICVGDSITAGTGALSAWRYGLFENLYKDGANFRLVGSQSTTADFRLPEGYQGYSATGGYMTNDILTKLPVYLDRDFDIFAMQIGYNDWAHGVEIETQIANYKAILDGVYAANPDAHVYISTMCPCRNYITKQDEWLTTGINAHLDDIAGEYAALGYNITKINNVTGYGWVYDDFPSTDVVHPNEQGLRRISAAFYDAMKSDVLAYSKGYEYKFNPTVHVDGISLNIGNVSIEADAAKSAVATVSPADANIKTVLWSSDNEAIAKVDDNGRITGVAEGTCTVTATTLDGGYTDTVSVTVTASTEGEKTAVYTSNFTSLDGWTASKDGIFNPSWTTACTVGMVDTTATLTSDAAYTNNGNFKLCFTYNTSGNESSFGDNAYGSISYAGFELRAIDVNRKVALYYNGEQLGIYSSVACIRPTVFSMTYIDGVATAYIDGEAVITAEVADVATESNIVYSHNQMYRNCILKDVKLYNYN